MLVYGFGLTKIEDGSFRAEGYARNCWRKQLGTGYLLYGPSLSRQTVGIDETAEVRRGAGGKRPVHAG
jgi:hypothetical protein